MRGREKDIPDTHYETLPQVSFIVVENLGVEILIGMKALISMGVNIDCGRRLVTIGERNIPFGWVKEEDQEVTVKERILVKKGQGTKVPVNIKGDNENHINVFGESLGRRIKVMDGCHFIKEDNFIYVENYGHYDVWLGKDLIIGRTQERTSTFEVSNNFVIETELGESLPEEVKEELEKVVLGDVAKKNKKS